MTIVLKKVISDMEKQLNNYIDSANYYHKNFREYEQKIISLKESLGDLKKLEEVL